MKDQPEVYQDIKRLMALGVPPDRAAQMSDERRKFIIYNAYIKYGGAIIRD